MAKNYPESKGRNPNGRYVSLPYCVLESENFCKLSGNATKLLVQLLKQYNGSNNGSFKASWAFMRSIGWSSPITLSRCIKELTYYGFILQTQQGGFNKLSLYGASWLQVNMADDASISKKYVATKQIPNFYKDSKPKYKPSPCKQDNVVPIETAKRRISE